MQSFSNLSHDMFLVCGISLVGPDQHDLENKTKIEHIDSVLKVIRYPIILLNFGIRYIDVYIYQVDM